MELLSSSSYSFQYLGLKIFSTVLRRIEIRAPSSSSSFRDILSLRSPPFFPPLRKAIALTCRRGNWTVRTSRVVVASSKKHHARLGKNFWVRYAFFFRFHWSIRVDYDRKKKYTRLSNKLRLHFFSQINIFGFVLTCSFFIE